MSTRPSVAPTAVWTLPRRGVIRSVSSSEVPPDGLRDASNIQIYEGSVRPRFGMTEFETDIFGARVTGAYEYINAAGTIIPLAGTTNKIWAYVAGAWVNKTGSTVPATDANQQARFTSLQIGTPVDATAVYVLYVDGETLPQYWDGGSGNFANVPGSPPIWADAITVVDRIVGFVPPYLITWGDPNHPTIWPALNFRTLSDTPDVIVGMRPIGSTGFTVYKKESLWVGSPVAGSAAAAFRVDFKAFVDGPASKVAITSAGGVDYYMTADGRVGAWDGSTHKWVADEVWEKIRSELDPVYSDRIFGVYNGRFNHIEFHYPKTGASGECFGYLLLQLPTETEGAVGIPAKPAAFPGTLLTAVSAATGIRATGVAKRVLVFSSTTSDQRSFTREGTTDDGDEFPCLIQPGLATMKGGMPHRVEGLEVFANRGDDYGGGDLTPLTTDTFSNEDGAPGELAQLDLTKAKSAYDLVDVNAKGRFISFKLEFDSDVTMRYRGAALYSRPENQAAGGQR